MTIPSALIPSKPLPPGMSYAKSVRCGYGIPTEFQIVDRINRVGGCWLWTGPRNNHGYGQISIKINGKRVVKLAHRVSYEMFIGLIQDGLTIDHLCRNPPCINPDHLEVVSMRINTLRGVAPSAQNARKTHCPNGHPYDRVRQRGSRVCSICERAYRKRQKATQEYQSI